MGRMGLAAGLLSLLAGCEGVVLTPDERPPNDPADAGRSDAPGIRLLDGSVGWGGDAGLPPPVGADAGGGGSLDAGGTDAAAAERDGGEAQDARAQDAQAQDARAQDAGGHRCADGPLDEPIDDCRPAPPPSTGNLYEDCVRRINQLRWECQCLPPLERWGEGEGCADQHAQYDSTREAHAGFNAGICSPGGSAQNECPGYPSEGSIIGACLQAMWDEGPGEPFEEHGHYLNMTNPRFTRVACGFYTTPEGAVWSVQNFQ